MLPQKQISDNITDLPSRWRIARRRCSKETPDPMIPKLQSIIVDLQTQTVRATANHLTHTPHQNPMMLPQKQASDNINNVASEQESDNAKQI
jgi:hypothetical protein